MTVHLDSQTSALVDIVAHRQDCSRWTAMRLPPTV